MQIPQTLKKECRANTELEYFLYIQEMRQAIDLAKPIVDKMLKSFLEMEDIYKYYNIPEAIIKLNQAISELEKFGLKKALINTSPIFGPIHTINFLSWFTWWEDYLASLTETEIRDLEKARYNGDDISHWRPNGTWKNYI